MKGLLIIAVVCMIAMSYRLFTSRASRRIRPLDDPQQLDQVLNQYKFLDD